ncbi:NB-ARC domain-containing protein [Capilliphycus salinus ALCB114379]|uniref:NB-ARC domain-containing protein n=1 Tax=Capilliphycus salinus TaxID=2768948 RepID=UPI0039A6DDE1
MPTLRQRCRKVAILTQQGFQKLQTAQSQTNLWNDFTKSCTLAALSEQTGLSTHTLSKVHARKKGVDLQTLARYFNGFNLTLEPDDYMPPRGHEETTILVPSTPENEALVTAFPPQNHVVSWGLAPDVSMFCGRTTELETLQQWVLEDRCRLITLFGIVGIGKTWLATKLAEQIQPEFKVLVWRSLQPISRSHSPLPFGDFLDDLINNLTGESHPSIPENINAKIRKLMDILRRKRCLLILDNVESILPSQIPKIASINDYDYEAYSQLLKHLAQAKHQSCVILTSQVEPTEIQPFIGENLGVHSLGVRGLQVADIQQMLNAKGKFQGTDDEWNRLVEYYDGNPLILALVATTIQRFFDSSLTNFFNHKTLISEDIGELLDEQLSALSVPAQQIIKALATQNAPLSFSQLRSHLSHSISGNTLLGTLEFLKARALVDTTSALFSLHPLLIHYLTS